MNPDGKPWTAPAIDRLAKYVAALDPSDFKKQEDARPFHVAKKYRDSDKTSTVLRSWGWRQLRYEVLKERGARREHCGATPADSWIEVDHIKPVSKHWDLRLDKTNLQVLRRPATKATAPPYGRLPTPLRPLRVAIFEFKSSLDREII